MTWQIIEECRDQQKSSDGKIIDAINLSMICRVTWDEVNGKRIAHLANGDKVELKSSATVSPNLDSILNLMPRMPN